MRRPLCVCKHHFSSHRYRPDDLGTLGPRECTVKDCLCLRYESMAAALEACRQRRRAHYAEVNGLTLQKFWVLQDRLGDVFAAKSEAEVFEIAQLDKGSYPVRVWTTEAHDLGLARLQPRPSKWTTFMTAPKTN